MGFELILCRVWNDNDFEYREKFKDKEIVIPSRKCIEMEHMEAVEFLGVFQPIVRDYDGQPDPKFFKKLRIEKTSKAVPQVAKAIELVCQACGFTAKNSKELDEHIDANHLDSLADEKEADKRRKAAESGGKKILT